jgi:ATP-dependent helicase HrpA
LGWLVPGLLEEKLLTMIRSLPKSLRRNFVPAPDSAKKAVGMLRYGEGNFYQEVSRVLSDISGERISVNALRENIELPQHLKFNLQVVDEKGKRLAEGREIDQLYNELGIDAKKSSNIVEHDQWSRDEITTWDIEELPKKVELQRGDFKVTCFPALIDRETSVSLRLLDHKRQAELQTRHGIRRLFCIKERKELRSQVSWFPDLAKIELHASTLKQTNTLVDELTVLIADRALFRSKDLPRTAEEFIEKASTGKKYIVDAVQELAKMIGRLFNNYHDVRLRLDNLTSSQALAAKADIERQVARLLCDGFLRTTPWMWLQNLPRYLKAILTRIEKLSDARHVRDQQAMEELAPFLQRYEESLEDYESLRFDAEWEMYRWMLEELRISLFAQEVGTTMKVSPQRMDKQWDKIGNA